MTVLRGNISISENKHLAQQAMCFFRSVNCFKHKLSFLLVMSIFSISNEHILLLWHMQRASGPFGFDGLIRLTGCICFWEDRADSETALADDHLFWAQHHQRPKQTTAFHGKWVCDRQNCKSGVLPCQELQPEGKWTFSKGMLAPMLQCSP